VPVEQAQLPAVGELEIILFLTLLRLLAAAEAVTLGLRV
jgi:hypothetical protein